MTALVKGSLAKRSRAKPFNDHCSNGRNSTRFFSKIASIFKKSATFKGQ